MMTKAPSDSGDDLRLLSATEIAARIRDGRLTSRAAVDTHIAQIERVNPVINAVVKERFAAARAEADAADQLRARVPKESLPLFHGVPCTIKETFALEGMPQCAGLVVRRDYRAPSDAITVKRLRAAGAIPMGVTNTSELAMWMESVNKVYGRSNNPYDAGRIVGGSSGGEGAIIAAGASPFGLGSDVGGSIRGPAFFNGIFGHKPTGGLIPNSGQYPMMENETLRLLCAGPMTRRAIDLMPLLRVLAGPDGDDKSCAAMEIGDPSTVSLEGRRLLNVVDNGEMRVSKDLMDAQERVATALEARGMQRKTVAFRGLKKQFEIWSAAMGNERGMPVGRMLKDGGQMRPLWEMMKFAAGQSDHTVMALVLAAVDPVPHLFPKLNAKITKIGKLLRQEMLDALGDDGVLLYPTYISPAPHHSRPVLMALRMKLPFAYQGIMNVLELPATQVPLGLNAKGLPLGVQVVSKHGNDHVTIAIAEELERIFGGWVPPPCATDNATS